MGRPGATRTRACLLHRREPPYPLDHGPAETRRGSNPIDGFADRLSPGESRAVVPSGRFERPTSSFGRWRSIRCATRT